MSRRPWALFVFAALAIPGVAVAQTTTSPAPPQAIQQTQTFGMVGLASGQVARLNVLNPGVSAPLATAAMCPAKLSFLDSSGNVLKVESVTVPNGQSLSFDLSRDADITSTALRVEVRATIQMASSTVATPLASVIVPSLCSLFPTLEVFDASTGKTEAVLESTRSSAGPVLLTP